MVPLLLFALVGQALATANSTGPCQQVKVIDRTIRDAFLAQPNFYTILPKIELTEMLDNVCFTMFPLPDDPDTFHLYQSRVFCDGSSDVKSFIGVQFGSSTKLASPFIAGTDYPIGFACDTYIFYRCYDFGNFFPPYVYGISNNCHPTPLSCLTKVEEIIRDQGVPDNEYFILPMKLPNRCVTQQICVLPPNPFYNKLPDHPVVDLF